MYVFRVMTRVVTCFYVELPSNEWFYSCGLMSQFNSISVMLRHCLSICRTFTCLKSGPEVIKLFSSSTQLSMKIFLLINVKMPTIEHSRLI